jgi:dGTPase
MKSNEADALAAFRKFNYDNIYMREASRNQAKSVIDLLRALVEHYVAHPASHGHTATPRNFPKSEPAGIT